MKVPSVTCCVCGRFVKYDDIMEGKAGARWPSSHDPDLDLEFYCRDHWKEKTDDNISS